MATQTLAQADAILKDLYVGPIVEQLNQKTYLLDQIERDADHIDHTGRRAVVPLHKNRNRGRASIADGGNLPAAGYQAYLDAIIPLRYHVGAIELTDQAIEATRTNEGAFVSLLESETKGVAVDMRKDINRQCFGTGDGLLGTAASASGQVITLGTSGDVQYVQIGDTIDLLVKTTGATTAGGVGLVVTARTVSATPTVTVTGTITTAGSIDNTYGVYINTNRNNEMDGLRNISATTGRTLHSVNSATAGNAFWDPQTIAASGIAGESLFEQLADKIGAQGNGDVEVFLTSRGIRRRLADSYQSQKRFNDARAVDVHGGYSAIMVNEVPVVADDDAPKGFAFGFNKSAFKWFEQVKPGWLQMEGGDIFQLKSAGTGTWAAVWQAYFKWYACFACVAPNRTGAITGATDDLPQ
jgi:hypothetical protein